MIRLGESSWVDVVWAFMVARRGSTGDVGLSMQGELAHHPRATIKAHPSTLHHPRPYGRHRVHYTPVWACTRPSLMAARRAAWSRSAWSAYVSANEAIARSNVSPFPR